MGLSPAGLWLRLRLRLCPVCLWTAARAPRAGRPSAHQNPANQAPEWNPPRLDTTGGIQDGGISVRVRELRL